MENIKELVKKKLEERGFNVVDSNKYTFLISKDDHEKFIKVINTKGKYAHWKANSKDEEINNNLYYICVRNDGNYKFHIISSFDFSFFIKMYHNNFIKNNGSNKATSIIREFLDKPSIHVPNKKENEYLDNWCILD